MHSDVSPVLEHVPVPVCKVFFLVLEKLINLIIVWMGIKSKYEERKHQDSMPQSICGASSERTRNPIYRSLSVFVSQCLRVLAQKLRSQFPQKLDPEQGKLCISSPFTEDVSSYGVTSQEKESLSCCAFFWCRRNIKLKDKSLIQFSIPMKQEQLNLSYKAPKLLASITTTHSCEENFSLVLTV